MSFQIWSPDDTAPAGADKYHGAIAANYDDKREKSQKWIVEQAIIEDMLDGLPAGAWILDCPVGTGRFLKAYDERKYQVWAFDKSEDMLQKAHAKAVEQGLELKRFRFGVQNLLKLPLQDKSVDCSVAVRITRWLTPDECRAAWAELARVSRQRIVFTARVANHQHARPLDLFEQPGWKIARNEQGYEPDYRIIAMETV